MSVNRVYDGALACDKCDKCPVVDHDTEAGTVAIHDPHKPQNGRMVMSVEEFNTMLAKARPIA